MTQPLHTSPRNTPFMAVLSTGIKTVAEWTPRGLSVSVSADDDREFDVVGWVA